MKNVLHHFAFYLFFLISISTTAQQLQWIQQMNYSWYLSETIGLETDQNGNLYTAGNFNSPGSPYDDYSVFIKKSDPQGNTLWESVVSAKPSSLFHKVVLTSFTAESNFLYATGYFIADSVSFGNITLTDSMRNGEVFLLKYNLSGNIIWAKSRNDITNQVIKYHNNSLFSSEYQYLKKYDLNGNLLWSKTVAQFKTYQIASSDSNHIYLRTGDGASYDPDSIQKYDLNGNKIWSKAIPGYGLSITADDAGNCYVASTFLYGTTFGSYPVSAAQGATWGDAIAKLDSNGNWQWATSISYEANALYKDRQTPYLIGVGRDGINGFFQEYDTNGTYQQGISLGQNYEGHYIARYNQSIYIAGQTGGQYPQAFIARVDDNTLPLSVNELKQNNDFVIYPNPATQEINIILNENNTFRKAQYDIVLSNLLGEKLGTWHITNSDSLTKIDVSCFPKGVYFIEILSDKEKSNQKVILQ